jgi:peptidoglycan/LPS O-acetylase OafA/YrhL
MPFLRARQALMFPIGISLFEYKNILKRLENINLFWIGTLLGVGLILQLLAQQPIVKNCPYLISNVLYLVINTTLAFCVLVTSLKYKSIFNNHAFYFCGVISFELFLIHGYLLRSMNTIPKVFLSAFCLFVLAYLFNRINNLYNSKGDKHLNV